MNQYLPDSYGDEEILFTPYTGKIQKLFIQQHDEMDCAAATLAMIASSFGKRISLKDCRDLIDIGLNGATYYSIVLASDFLGIRTCAAKISFDQISELRVPFIAHYQITSRALGNANSHFVVVYQVKGNRILIADPEFDLIWLSIDDFFKRFSGNVIAFDPTEKFFKLDDSKPNLVTILTLIKSHRLLITFMVIASLLVSILSVFPIIYFGKLIDELGKEGFHANEVLILLAGLMGIKITAQILKTARQMLANFLSLKLSYKLTLKMHFKTLQLPLSDVNSRKPGDFLSRIDGTSDVESFISNAFSVFFVDSIFAVIFLVTLFKMSAYFGLLSIFSILIFSIFIQQISQWSKKKTYKILSETAMVQTSLVYNLRYLSTMRLFSKEIFFFHKWVLLFKKLGTYLYFFKRNFLLFKSFETLVMIMISGIAMFIGIYLIQQGHFTVGILVSSLSLLDQCLDPVFSIGQAYDSYLRSMVSIDRMNDILTSKKESSGELPVHSINTIEFKDVSFSYSKVLSKKVLSGFNLKIHRGDFVVLVGESGSGKSTLLSLLLRFYDPSSGSIFINGISIYDYKISDIRRKFSLLPQPVLMPLTILQNIAFGEYQPDLERVFWSLKMANAENFVNNLPMNLDTLLQEDGRGLSGGQKQRIALARALYFDSEVLLLDEPHSALDAVSQQMIVDTLKSLNQSGKTVIVSTHRPELFSFANRIVKIYQ